MKNTRRFLMYISGIFILALGTVLFTRSQLGVSATVSLPYVCSLITSATLGQCTTFIYSLFVAIELIIYREWRIKVVLQLPFSFAYGGLIDFYNDLLDFKLQNSVLQIICLVVAIIATGVGVAMMVKGNYVVNPPAGIIEALMVVFKREYGTVKCNFDLASVALATIISLLATGRILGIGIGTVIAVFAIGNIIRFTNHKIINKIIVE